MEKEVLYIIITAISGPILTIAVKESFDYYKKRQELNFDLNRTFINKKLEAAENAIKLWQSQRFIYIELSSLYKEAVRSVEFGASQQFQDISQNYVKQLDKLTLQSHEVTNSVFLYYNLKEVYKPSKSLHQLVGDLHAVDGMIKIISKLQEEEPNDKEFYNKKMEEEIEKAKKNMLDISSLLIEAELYLTKCIFQVKSEIDATFSNAK